MHAVSYPVVYTETLRLDKTLRYNNRDGWSGRQKGLARARRRIGSRRGGEIDKQRTGEMVGVFARSLRTRLPRMTAKSYTMGTRNLRAKARHIGLEGRVITCHHIGIVRGRGEAPGICVIDRYGRNAWARRKA